MVEAAAHCRQAQGILLALQPPLHPPQSTPPATLLSLELTGLPRPKVPLTNLMPLLMPHLPALLGPQLRQQSLPALAWMRALCHMPTLMHLFLLHPLQLLHLLTHDVLIVSQTLSDVICHVGL